MANMYRSVLASGGGTPTGNAQPAEVLNGKTFENSNGPQTGTMPNNGAVSGTATPSQPYTIPEGYHNGLGTVTGSGGNVDTSFVPTGTNMNVAGTNFTIGKYYVMAIVGAGATWEGATQIGNVATTAQGPMACLVLATDTTIKYGVAGANAAYPAPIEITL